LETPSNQKTDNNKKMLGDDAMAGMLLDADKKKGSKSASKQQKAGGQTDTCGCSIF